MRIGFGYDAHRLCPGDGVVIGGVKISCDYSLIAHSDGDVAVHALMDALLGALCLGDIGRHFPDTSDEFKNIDSCKLLERVIKIISDEGYCLSNADITIVAQHPRLSPHIEAMREKLSHVMDVPVFSVGVKATTEENMGFTGRSEGVCAYAVCLLNETDI